MSLEAGHLELPRLCIGDADGKARIWKKLESAVHRICPGWLQNRREDLAQSAFLRVMEAARRRDDEASFSPSYLQRVAYSTVIDEIRRLRSRNEVPVLEAGGGADSAANQPTAQTPEDGASDKEVGRAILGCLANMAEDRRMAVVLYLQGHTLDQASTLLGWPAKRTENLTYRGLANLRTCLATKGFTR